MTDDLVKRLRNLVGQYIGGDNIDDELQDAAIRIEKLEERVEDLESFQECACAYDKPTDICAFHKQLFDKITTVRLDRIEKLEAALRKYGSNFCEFACGEPCGHLEWDQCSGCEAYKALEGKDD